MASSSVPQTITGTSPLYVANMTALASRVFAFDPFPVMVLRERRNLTTTTRADLARHYSERIDAKTRAGAVIIDAGAGLRPRSGSFRTPCQTPPWASQVRSQRGV